MPTPRLLLPAHVRPLAVLVASLAFAACGGQQTAPPSPSGSPGASSAFSAPPASADPTVGAIDHKTGATDVILRIEQGGGFVPIDFLASQAPGFTLYGNGVVVFQRTVTTFPQPDANGVLKAVPWRTASVDEGQVQQLLEFALGQGGLGSARDKYLSDGIADAPNTIFTIRAGGLDKTVVVNALSEETRPGPDAVARSAFLSLAKRLQDFDLGGTISSDVYEADRYRGVLSPRDGAPAGTSLDWPWPAIKPIEFKEGPSDGSGATILPHRTMSTDEVAALKLADIEGGVQGLTLRGPDGAIYSFILRPLLVDEKD